MTLDEMLADQVKRLPPDLRAQLSPPSRYAAKPTRGGGIGLTSLKSEEPWGLADDTNEGLAGPWAKDYRDPVSDARKAVTADSYPRDFAGRASREGYSESFPGQGLPKVLTDSKARRRWQEKGISEPFRGSDNSRSLAPNASDTELRGSAGLRPRDLLRQGGLARGGNVIIQGNQGPPAPASSPGSFGEALQVAQAGLATANTDLAPLLSDWRTSPAAALAAFTGGYGRGSYAAQKDLAAGRAEKQKADREAMQLAAQERLISQLPEDQRLLAQLDPGAFAQARIKQAFPEPIDPGLTAKLGQDQQQFEAQMGLNREKSEADRQQFIAEQDLKLQALQQSGQISQAQLDIERAKLKQGSGGSQSRYEISGGVVLDKFTGTTTRAPYGTSSDTPVGKLLAERDSLPEGDPRRQIYDDALAKATALDSGGGVTPDKLTKLISARDALAPDDPNRKIYDAAIQKQTTASQGLTVYDPNTGNPIVTSGGGSPGTMAVTPTGQNKISQYRASRENLNAAIADYKNMVGKTGGTIIPGTAESAALDAAQTRVMMGAKNLYELGAPTGPDIQLLQNMIPSASGLGGVINPVGRVESGLEALEKDIGTMTESVERGYGGESAVSRPSPTAGPATAPASGSPAGGYDPAAEAAALIARAKQPKSAPSPQAAQAFGPGGYLDPIAGTPPSLGKKKPAAAEDLSYFGFAP